MPNKHIHTERMKASRKSARNYKEEKRREEERTRNRPEYIKGSVEKIRKSVENVQIFGRKKGRGEERIVEERRGNQRTYFRFS